MDHVPYSSADEAYITAGTLIALSSAVHQLTNYDTKVAADAQSRIACWTDSRHAFTTAAAAEEVGMAEIHRRVTVAEGQARRLPGQGPPGHREAAVAGEAARGRRQRPAARRAR